MDNSTCPANERKMTSIFERYLSDGKVAEYPIQKGQLALDGNSDLEELFEEKEDFNYFIK